MAMVIYKHPFEDVGTFTLELPEHSQILSCQVQTKISDNNRLNDQPCLWVLVDTEMLTIKRHFKLFSTGEIINQIADLKFIGTFQMGLYVYHLFEDVSQFIMRV